MTTEIATIDIKNVTELAQVFMASGLFSDTKSQAQAIVKIIAGAELGLSPFVAMRDLNIIQGKIALAGAQIGAKIQQAGGSWECLEHGDDRCVLRFFNGGKQQKPDVEFSMSHAKKLGMASKDNYQKQARTMLFWRAMTMGARMFFPGVFNGNVYAEEELINSNSATPIAAEIVEIVDNEQAAADIETQQRQNYLKQQAAKLAKAESTGEYIFEFGSEKGRPLSGCANGIFLKKHLEKYKDQLSPVAVQAIEMRLTELRREYAQTQERLRQAQQDAAEQGDSLTEEEKAEILAEEAQSEA